MLGSSGVTLKVRGSCHLRGAEKLNLVATTEAILTLNFFSLALELS